ncbi:MAG: GlsB/YeaQ/YmgE family stress response membrane protein [Blautia sp.]|nr:GlsB/YeaQ/YmgE family stress response membrane protein [Blautia sp.]
MMGIIITLITGAIAGWLAGKLMDSEGSMIRNILLGLIGGVVGSIVLGIFGLHGSGLIGGTIVSVVGACILIWLSKRL